MSSSKLIVVGCLIQLLLLLVSDGTDGAGVSLYEKHLLKRQADSAVSSKDENTGLYDSNDSVISLNAANLKAQVYGKSHASLVEFYNSYCGFCRRYAPVWKQLASDILGWNRQVKVTALDCSRDENNAICREFEVMAYPTIRFFAPYYEDGDQKIGELVLLEVHVLKRCWVSVAYTQMAGCAIRDGVRKELLWTGEIKKSIDRRLDPC